MNDIQLCCAYCFFILGQEEQESYRGEKADFYIADGTRTWLHDELCKALGLTKNETREVTDNLSNYKFNPHRVYEALCGIKRERNEKGEAKA
ncbi:hypothetical protein AGMMS50268_03860 [Spirochaetia bacterium]|nr:hypothetical protein AGMMS50268_03860 [Spirochaetia bacterium]